MKHLAILLAPLIALSLASPAGAESFPAGEPVHSIYGTPSCVEFVGVVEWKAYGMPGSLIAESSESSLIGATMNFETTTRHPNPGQVRFWIVVEGTGYEARAYVPDCEGPGVKPRDRFIPQRKRSCKTEAVVKSRAVFVDHVVSTDATGDEFWESVISRTNWTRILPTPSGCVRAHKAWERRHKGQVRGGRA